jgi:nucleoside-diphosphate-sugar epimerase
MDDALVVGGTRFIGRHLVEELLEQDYHVTLFNRGTHENPFADGDGGPARAAGGTASDEQREFDGVDHVEGDRTNDSALEAAAAQVDPQVVFDVVAYQPRDVRAATEIFADVDAYVYVSSGGAYGEEVVPKREGETALEPCTPAQATGDGMATYGARKAEGDRAVFAAAERGVDAMSVRPSVVYGPHDYTERLDYWIDRVVTHDRVVVPGDGDLLWHRAYVEDVAAALRVVAENGTPGEAYNVGDRRLVTFAEMVELIADAADTDVEVVTAAERELAAADLAPEDFPLYRDYPHVLDTAKLAALGWDSTPLGEAMERTVAESVDSDRDGRENGPAREAEERVLGVLDTL